MGVAEIVKMIAEFGIIPVVLAVILCVIIMCLRRINEASRAQEKSLQAQKDSLLAQEERLANLIEVSIKSTSKVHSKDEEEDSRKVNNFIAAQLNCILKENKANRVYCVAYHNGGSFINARNFTKCSIIAEAVDNKTKSIAQDYQNVQRALLIELDNALVTNGECYISNINDIKEIAPGCYQLLNAMGTSAWYSKALVDTSTGVILGFIAADYTDDRPENEYDVQLNLSKKAQRISGAIQMTSLNRQED